MSLQEISLEITQQCPNNCIHCSSYASWKTSQYIPFDLLCTTIDQAVELGAKIICLSGGEPFVHPDFVKIVQYIHCKDVACYVYTSGIFYDGIKYQTLPDDILADIRGSVDKMIFNYEAANSEIYDAIMGTDFGGYDIMRQSIRKVVAMKIMSEAHVVPMKINFRQIPLIIEQCDELSIKRISFLRLVLHGRALDFQEKVCLSNEEIEEVKRKIKEISRSKSVAIRMGIPFSDCVNRINCMTATKKINIRYDGVVYPCEAFKNDLPENFTVARPESIYGKSFREIYNNSPYLQEIREKLIAYQRINTCENCINQYYRNGGLS